MLAMDQVNLDKIKKVHFIGIGGIGISAIARMMLAEGKEVSGSDQSLSPVTDELSQSGAIVYQGHNASHISAEIDLVVYTIAIPISNPELTKAKDLGIKMMSYPEVIGQISKNKKTIAVSGAHGKTTTTAMIAEVMLGAGYDPTVVVGSILKGHKSNFIAGQGEYFVVEACEYRRSFLNLYPQILVITNIEADHLDYYQDLADIQSAFRELAERVPADGFIVCDPSDPNVAPVLTEVQATVVDYTQFDTSNLELQVPGAHNFKNAQAAGAAAESVGVDVAVIKAGLSQFAGTWRRFDYRGQTKAGALVYDDYAHHPTEIKATVAAARQLAGDRRLIVAFQPHLYSRTKLLFDDFVKAFEGVDYLVLAPIYAAREVDDGTVSSETLAEVVREHGIKVEYAATFAEMVQKIEGVAQSGDLVVTMGAGELFKVAETLVAKEPGR